MIEFRTIKRKVKLTGLIPFCFAYYYKSYLQYREVTEDETTVRATEWRDVVVDGEV